MSAFTTNTIGLMKNRKFDYSILDPHELKIKELIDYLQASTLLPAMSSVKASNFSFDLNIDGVDLSVEDKFDEDDNGRLLSPIPKRDKYLESEQSIGEHQDNKVVYSEQLDYKKAQTKNQRLISNHQAKVALIPNDAVHFSLNILYKISDTQYTPPYGTYSIIL